MICPRCGHEGDANQHACWYCGFIPPLPSPEGHSTGEPQNKREGLASRPRVENPQSASNNIPGRPVQRPSSYLQPAEQPKKQHPSLHATRVSTTPLSYEKKPEQALVPSSSASGVAHVLSSAQSTTDTKDEIVFSPGALLKGGRYRLIKKQEELRWANDIYESHWTAQDLFQKGANVIISELGLSDMKTATRQTHLRTGMRALFSAGAHPHISTLTNVFREGGRDLFVFEAIDGETLAGLMKHRGQTLPEQDVIECCLQILDALEAMTTQTPPLIHGLINPDHLVLTRAESWFLTDFSVVLASGAGSYITNLDPASLPPFAAPEFAKGTINIGSDLYALLATAFFAITGAMPRGQLSTARISPALGAVFQKGLHPVASQRYQQPSALRQDLQALRTSVSSSLSLQELDISRNALPPLSRPETDRGMLPSLNGPETDWGALPPLNRPETDRGMLPSLNGPETDWGALPPLNRPEIDRGILPPLTSQGQAQRMPMVTPPISRRSEPGLSSAQGATLAYTNQPVPNSISQAFSSMSFPDDLDIPVRNLLPAPESLPPMQPGNDILVAFLWMGGIVLCLLVLVLLK